MALYEYRCLTCKRVSEHFVPMEARHHPQPCVCGGLAEKIFSRQRVKVTQPYFDEGLGCDVHGERERQQILRSEGLIEAGDPVGGSRNFDFNGVHAGRHDPVGLRYSDRQFRNDSPEVHDASNFEMAAANKDGSVTPMRFEDGDAGRIL